MCMKTRIQKAAKKTGQLQGVLIVEWELILYCMVVHEDQIYVDFIIGFLSMKIYMHGV